MHYRWDYGAAIQAIFQRNKKMYKNLYWCTLSRSSYIHLFSRMYESDCKNKVCPSTYQEEKLIAEHACVYEI